MKIYWGLRRKHADVLANIDRLEHELGIDNSALLGPGPRKREIAAPLDLSHLKRRTSPNLIVDIKGNLTDALFFGPGAVIPVNEGGSVEFLPAYSSVVSAPVQSVLKRSRIELPPGVTLH